MCPQLLAVLAGCDLVYLVTMLLESIRKFGLETRFFISSPISVFASISFLSRLHLLLIPYLLFPLNAISMMASVYMTLALAVERFPFELGHKINSFTSFDFEHISFRMTGQSKYVLGHITLTRYLAVYRPLDYSRMATDSSSHLRWIFSANSSKFGFIEN